MLWWRRGIRDWNLKLELKGGKLEVGEIEVV